MRETSVQGRLANIILQYAAQVQALRQPGHSGGRCCGQRRAAGYGRFRALVGGVDASGSAVALATPGDLPDFTEWPGARFLLGLKWNFSNKLESG